MEHVEAKLDLERWLQRVYRNELEPKMTFRCGDCDQIAEQLMPVPDFDSVLVEHRLPGNGRRPDVVLLNKGFPVMGFEVFVTHAVSENKAKDLNISWIEVFGRRVKKDQWEVRQSSFDLDGEHDCAPLPDVEMFSRSGVLEVAESIRVHQLSGTDQDIRRAVCARTEISRHKQRRARINLPCRDVIETSATKGRKRYFICSYDAIGNQFHVREMASREVFAKLRSAVTYSSDRKTTSEAESSRKARGTDVYNRTQRLFSRVYREKIQRGEGQPLERRDWYLNGNGRILELRTIRNPRGGVWEVERRLFSEPLRVESSEVPEHVRDGIQHEAY